MKTVGQLDDDDARVLGDRDEELAVVLDLPLFTAVQREHTNLRQAVDDLRHFRPEFLLDFLDRDCRVFDNVVDQSRGDGNRVELQFSENARHLDAMRDERIAVAPELSLMGRRAESIGAREQVDVESLETRVVRRPAGDEFVAESCGHLKRADGQTGKRAVDRTRLPACPIARLPEKP